MITKEKNTMVEKERSIYGKTEDSSNKEKRQKGIIKKKKKLLARRKTVFGIPSGISLPGEYFMLAANINLPEYSKIEATHAGCKLL